MVAHPPSDTSNRNEKMPLLSFIMSSLLSFLWNRRRNNLQPALRTLFNIRIVALGIVGAVIPVILFLWLWGRLDIYWRLLLDDSGWRIVWIIRIVWIARGTPPPWAPSTPSWPDPDTTSTKMVS
jgi:hypothetical protein